MPHAAVVRGLDGPMKIEEVAYRPLREGEVLVKLAACGVCHSDLSVLNAVIPCKLPVILGHEAAGVVVETGPGVGSVAKGDRVVALWKPHCGQCRFCREGKEHLCKLGDDPSATAGDRVTAGGEPVTEFLGVGGFSEMTILAENALVKIDPAMPLDRAALLGCAVITGFGAARNTAKVPEGAEVAVFGCGGVGLNIVQGARHCGAKAVIAVDLDPAKLAMARDFGATHTLDGTAADLVKQIKTLTREGRGVDVAFEAVGNAKLAETAAATLAKGGELVLVGVPGVKDSFPLYPFGTVLQEKSIRGTVGGGMAPRKFVPELVGLYQKKKLELDKLVTKTYSLAQANEAMDDLRAGRNARGVLIF